MSEQPKDPNDWQYKGPALDDSGKLVGDKLKPRPSAPRLSEVAPLAKEEKLELDEKRLPQPTQWSDPAPYRDDYKVPLRRRLALKASLLFIALGLVAMGVFVLMPRLQHQLPFRLPAGPARPLFITSDPAGAEVRINGTVVGQTPYAADNHWVGHVALELRLEGHETYRSSFEGSHEVNLSPTLKKKP